MSVSPLDFLADVIRSVSPNAAGAAASWAGLLQNRMKASGIVTVNRIAMFVAQVSVESAGFSALTENLVYNPERLCQVWPSRFPSVAAARPYGFNPIGLGNHVYADRMGNGPEASGDGYRFRGGGLIQITGRAMYEIFAADMNKPVDEAAAWVVTPPGAAASAVWFWNRAKVSALAEAADVAGVTRRINGGETDLARRSVAFAAARSALNGAIARPATADSLMAAEQARTAAG